MAFTILCYCLHVQILCVLHPAGQKKRWTLFWSVIFASETLWVLVMILFSTPYSWHFVSGFNWNTQDLHPVPDAVESVDWSDRSGCCDAVFLLLIQEYVWRKLCTGFPLSKLCTKILMNYLLTKVQLILHQFWSHLIVSVHHFTNFRNYFQPLSL